MFPGVKMLNYGLLAYKTPAGAGKTGKIVTGLNAAIRSICAIPLKNGLLNFKKCKKQACFKTKPWWESSGKW